MKHIKIFFPLLIVFFSSLTFNGCKKDDSNPVAPGDELVGTWQLTKLTITYLGTKYDYTPAQANFSMTLVIKSDRTYQTTTVDQGVTSIESGTWSLSNGKINIKHQDGSTESVSYTLVGNKLTYDTTSPSGPNGEELPTTLEFTKQ